MRLILLTLALILVSLPLFGGEMRIVKNKYDADVVIYITLHKYEADLYATVTDLGYYARNHDHYFKFVKYQTQNVVKVYFTKYKYEANVIVYYSTFDLGWRKSNQFQGRLH